MSNQTWWEVVGGPDDGRLVVVLRIENGKAITNYKTADRKYTTRFRRIPLQELHDPSKFKRLKA